MEIKLTAKGSAKEIAGLVSQLQSQQLIKVSSNFDNFLYPFVVGQNEKMCKRKNGFTD